MNAQVDTDRIISMVEAMGDLDFAKTPTIIFAGKLRDSLINSHGYRRVAAEELVLSMSIDLGSENPFSDEEMARLVTAYARLVVNAESGLIANGFRGMGALKAVASKFSLKLG